MSETHDIGMAGPRGLAAGVLLLALTDYREKNGYTASAAAWLFSDREDGTFSFLRVCDELNLDPAMVRRAARHGSVRRLREAGFLPGFE